MKKYIVGITAGMLVLGLAACTSEEVAEDSGPSQEFLTMQARLQGQKDLPKSELDDDLVYFAMDTGKSICIRAQEVGITKAVEENASRSVDNNQYYKGDIPTTDMYQVMIEALAANSGIETYCPEMLRAAGY